MRPLAVKVYPISYSGGTFKSWWMNDPRVAFPIYERAQEHGIKVIAVHKATPFGPVVAEGAFDPSDVEGAAGAFPDITFEIVHGGIAFNEETAWLLGRFPNIYVNLEIANVILERRPATFARAPLGLMHVGGMPVLDRLVWATGCALAHPRPALEAFARFTFPDDLLEGAGLFGPLEQITDEHKRNILGRNYARLHGIDVEAARAAIADDEFSRARATNPNPEPRSTTSKWELIRSRRSAEAAADAHRSPRHER
jgi:predicted TIM-barrel fold metal-dependent hydrolase